MNTKVVSRRKGYSCPWNVLLGYVITLLTLTVGCGGGGANKPLKPGFDAAVYLVEQGDQFAAIEMLQGIVAESPDSREGHRSALFLGSLLVKLKRFDEAVAPLELAARGSEGVPYANLLLVKAVVEGGIVANYEDAAGRGQSILDLGGDASEVLIRDATFLLCKLRTAQQAWEAAADHGGAYLDRWPDGRDANEARWLTGRGFEGSGDPKRAYEIFQDIWYETTASPWAKEARNRANELRRNNGYPPRAMTADQRYEFIQALRAAGLHEDALEELDTFFGVNRGHEKTDGALFMKAMSLYDVRKNSECVATVEELRRRFPRSKWAPSASIYAVKALRRSDNTPRVTSWCNRIYSDYPGHPKAYEALYNLGVYLGNVESEEQGLEVLRRLIREAPKHADADDAMWKIAWMERRRGRTLDAANTLEILLAEQPESGYRKAVLYWLARFRDETSNSGAAELYQTLLEENPNDYYGHKAAEELLAKGVQPRRIGNGRALGEIDTLDDPQRYQGSGAEAYQRACYLRRLGLFTFAADELAMVPAIDKNRSLQFGLASLYSRAGDTWDATDILKTHFKEFMAAGSRDPGLVPMDFWHIVYPFNYRDTVRTAISEAGLAGTQIDEYLVAALIRMESRFLTTAISPVGAIGLMQLMPDTAEQIAAERGLAKPTREELFRPGTNIRYGTYFLANRVRDFGGDWFPAICSYNAGVNPVREWWNLQPPGQEQDEFIENIPYVATRLYIKQILGDYKNYEWIYP